MKRKFWIIISIVIVLTIVGAVAGYFSFKHNQFISVQRQQYLDMASDYDSKASQTAEQAQILRNAALKASYLNLKQLYLDEAKHLDDLASEYRDQALKYRQLASK
jgi:hypothetical protein